MIVGISIAWFVAVIGYEIRRERACYPVDFLSLTNVIILLAFVIPPLGFLYVDAYELSVRNLFNGTFEPKGISLYVTMMALASHVLIVLIYEGMKRLPFVQKRIVGSFDRVSHSLTSQDITLVVIVLSVVGGIAFALYASSLGGWQKMWDFSHHIRSNKVQAQFGFFKIIAMLLVPAFYLAFASTLEQRGGLKPLWGLLSLFLGIVAFLLLYHDGSRLFLMIFILTPVLAYFAGKERGFYKFFPLIIGIILAYYLFGDSVFKTIFLDSEFKVPTFNSEVLFVKISGLLSEFSFPFFVLAEYIDRVPDTIAYRGVSDVINGFIILLPSVLVGPDPQYIFDINRSIFDAPIPIDALSFGYAAFGLIGTAIVVALFGGLIALCDMFFANAQRPFQIIIRTAFMLQIPWLIMYGDPVNAVKRVFATSVAFVLIMMFVVYRTKMES